MGVPKFKLKSSGFQRTAEENKTKPKRIFFIAAEGELTEPNYFRHLNSTLDTTIVRIEMLQQEKGRACNAPKHLIELLEEYIELREEGVIPPLLSKEFMEKYPPAKLEELMQSEQKDCELEKDLEVEGLDYWYRKYLHDLDSENDSFIVVLDRDRASHTRAMLLHCIAHCIKNNYDFYISNPCFEFWLLLHVIDIKATSDTGELERLLSNAKISLKHTYISQKLSIEAGHSKRITLKMFNEKYYPNIEQAIIRAESFATAPEKILDELGTNIHCLMRKILKGHD